MADSKKNEAAQAAPQIDPAEIEAERRKIIEAAEKEAEEIRAQAREEAQEIVKGAEDKAKAAQGAPTTMLAEPDGPRTEPVHNDGEDLVYIELFKDNDKYKDPLTVCVNGESILIERGVRVKIKRKFLWAIQNQQRQDKNTANLITVEAEAFRAAQRAHGDA